MAKTNWQDPGASEILSTQISGLQDAVSKMETILNIETESDTDIPLSYVTSYDPDTGLQTYRLFQAPVGKRNWLSTPSPVIKKNGTTISSDFYIDYGGGAVVFTTPVTVSDVITANVTYTIDEGDAGGGISPDMIVDDLTTNDPTKVLSAKQGKVLKDNADDLAGTGRTTETVKGNANNISNLQSADTQNVKLTGNQTVTGVKTFSDNPIVPTPTQNAHASTKQYVDQSIGAVVIPDNSLTEAKMANEMKKGIVGGVESYDDALAHKAETAKMIKIKTNIAILQTNWVDDTATSGYWLYDVTDTDITADMAVDVYIHLTSIANSTMLLPVNKSDAGKFTLYASSEPNEDIIIDYSVFNQMGGA